jgi:hypothetical protein
MIAVSFAPGKNSSTVSAQTSTSLYLPVITAGYPWISAFGFEATVSLASDATLQGRAVDLQMGWKRLNNRISWRALQPDENGPILWNLLADFENELKYFKSVGLEPVVIVDDYPRWATMDVRYDHQPTSCAPIKREKFPAFADFLTALVNRYKLSEFDVHHWEMGNEPDVDPDLVPPDSPFGCWGDIDDPYYGGRYYGEMLMAVAPAMRAADPEVVIWLGGLLLGSPNTTNPFLGKPELFLKGVLEIGAADSFDVVPYHWYPSYWNVKHDYDNASGNLDWDPLGGGTIGKARFLRQIMDSYFVSKPLFLNETALGCPYEYAWCNPPPVEFYDLQADHVVRSFTRGLSENVKGFIWYTFNGPGWRYTGLLDANEDVKPAYIAYQQLSIQLHNSQYVSVADYGPGIEAYAFERGGRQIIVLWRISPTGDPVIVSIPQSKFINAASRDGAALTPTPAGSDFQLPVEFSPIYVMRYP